MITLAEDVEMEFVRTPAGEFTMGCFPWAIPEHQVVLDEYWIGVTPVTERQYAIFPKETIKKKPSFLDRIPILGRLNKFLSTPRYDILPGKDTHPVAYVSWREARAFCQWLSKISGVKVRLPTEAEWEKAARGTDGRIYPWSDESPTGRCNYDNLYDDTTPVWKYSPQGDSPYGCVDMLGNLSEWTSSLYKDYPYSEYDGREDPNTKGDRVMRGCNFRTNIQSLHVAYRRREYPSVGWRFFGFRCAFT